MRAFIGKVRAENGVDYHTDLFIADIPLDVDVTSSHSGTQDQYPEPPEGITIRRLTHSMNVSGIVRGSPNGGQVAFAAPDDNGTDQLYIIQAVESEEQPIRVTSSNSQVSSIRWHPPGEWVFCISDGNVFVTYVGAGDNFGKTIKFSDDQLVRDQLVVSPDGNMLAYIVPVPTKDAFGKLVKDAAGKDFRQIFIMELDWGKIK
jgi:WD40 repeat protein